MYEKLLSMTWEDMLASDYVFKSNASKKIVQIEGSEVGESDDDSVFIIFYNVYVGGTPMILTQRYNKIIPDISPASVEGYSMYHKEGTDEDGNPFTEVTYVLCSLQEALNE